MARSTPSAAPLRRLRTREAAEYLGLSASYLERLRTQGGGPRFAAFGRAITYSPRDLDEWAFDRTVKNTAEARAQRRSSPR